APSRRGDRGCRYQVRGAHLASRHRAIGPLVAALWPREKASMKKRWTKPGEEAPAGALRRSQLLTTFGAGAMIDLVERSALVAGLDFWNYAGNQRPVINEPRLAARLVAQFKQIGILLNPLATLSPPPECDEDAPTPQAGLQVVEFPRWMVCQGCNVM